MFDLSGYWMADDGCQYYLSQHDSNVWWAGLDNHGWFHDGLLNANVFFGTIAETEEPGQPKYYTLGGLWFDVPRAPAMSSGYVALRIEVDGAGEVMALTRMSASGRLKPTQWHRSDQLVGGDSQFWFDKPIHRMDAEKFFQMAVKNSGNPLLGDLKPYRDVVVAYGWLFRDGGHPPEVSQQPGWATTVNDFFDTDHEGDRDATFSIGLNLDAFYEHLGRSDSYEQVGRSGLGWVAGRNPDVPGGKLDRASYGPDWPYQQGAQPPRLHCEMIMYGVTPADTGYIRVYPGRADHDGNSVLVNGKPINGLISLGGTAPDDDSVRTFDGLGGHPLPANGSYVRISGVLVLDCGHYQYWPPEGSPCYDDTSEAGWDWQNNVEIHPVFEIDVIDATPTVNVSGVWAAGNGDTIYLHQVGQTIAGLRLPPLGAGNALTVYYGTRQADKIDGSWRRVSPPVDGMPTVLGGHWDTDIVNAIPRLNFREMLSVEPDYDGWWTKLHDAVDQTPTMSIRPTAYLRDDPRYAAQGREGGTATFTVSPAHFPAEARFTYRWTVSAGGYDFGGAGELEEPSITLTELPSAGTAMTVSVEVQDDEGSQYEGTYEFAVLPPLAPDERRWWQLPVVAANQDGALSAFLIGQDTALYRYDQDGQDGAWGEAQSMAGTWPLQRPVVAANQDGALSAFLIGQDTALYRYDQDGQDGAWNAPPPRSMGGIWKR
jgi:hypothetical protein